MTKEITIKQINADILKFKDDFEVKYKVRPTVTVDLEALFLAHE